MNLTLENSRLILLIIQCWTNSILKVVFLKPSSYIPSITSNDVPKKSLGPEDWLRIKKIVKGVQRISPLLLKKRKCLMEALIVYNALKKRGISSSIKLGAFTTKDSIKTHAWVSVGNITILGGPTSEYKELVRIP